MKLLKKKEVYMGLTVLLIVGVLIFGGSA